MNARRAALLAAALTATTLAAPGRATSCPGVRRSGAWTTIDPPALSTSLLPDRFAPGLVADPGDARRLYLSDRRVVYRSTDGGCSWRVALDLASGPPFVAADPGYRVMQVVALPGGHVYALLVETTTPVTSFPVYVAASGDGGATWHVPDPVGDRVVLDALGGPRCASAWLAAAPSHPGTLYLRCLEVTTVLHATYVLYVTDDAARTWRRLVPGGFPFVDFVPWPVLVDPVEPRTLWTATGTETTPLDVYRSADGGATWKRAWTGFGPGMLFGGGSVVHRRGRPATVMVWGTGGMAESTDGGARWAVVRGLNRGESVGPIVAATYERDAATTFVLNAYNVPWTYSIDDTGRVCTLSQRAARRLRAERRWQTLTGPRTVPANAVLWFRSFSAGRGRYASLVEAYPTQADCLAGTGRRTYVVTYDAA